MSNVKIRNICTFFACEKNQTIAIVDFNFGWDWSIFWLNLGSVSIGEDKATTQFPNPGLHALNPIFGTSNNSQWKILIVVFISNMNLVCLFMLFFNVELVGIVLSLLFLPCLLLATLLDNGVENYTNIWANASPFTACEYFSIKSRRNISQSRSAMQNEKCVLLGSINMLLQVQSSINHSIKLYQQKRWV